METQTAAPACEVPESREAGRTLTAPAQRRTGRNLGDRALRARNSARTPGSRPAARRGRGLGWGWGPGPKSGVGARPRGTHCSRR